MLSRYGAIGILLAYVIVIASSSAIGLGDAPNHLARAYVIADLIFGHGAIFGALFEFHFQAVPYVLPDLLLTAAVETLGPRIALGAWTVVTFLSIPAALVLYFRLTLGENAKPLLEDEGALFLLLCSAYLSTDLFFVMGFFTFNLGIACAIVILALIELLRRRWSGRLFALYCGVVATAYLINLATLLILAAIVGVSAVLRLWFRASSLRREMLLFVPIVGMVAWHFGVAVHYRRATDLPEEVIIFRDTLRRKMVRSIFDRYGGRLDLLLRFIYVVGLVMLVRSRAWRHTFSSPRVIELLAVALAFFGMYLLLPFSYTGSSYLDIRMLAPATPILLLGCLHLPRSTRFSEGSRPARSPAVAVAFVLSLLNLAYLFKHFVELSNWSTPYRAIFASIPRGAHVLPVGTVRDMAKFMDPSPITVIDREAYFPFLFSGDGGQSMTYFRYIDPPYRPYENWYTQNPLLVDWHQVACTYQYILVSRPFDLQRFHVPTNSIAETSSAALLAIDPRACADTAGRPAL